MDTYSWCTTSDVLSGLSNLPLNSSLRGGRCTVQYLSPLVVGDLWTTWSSNWFQRGQGNHFTSCSAIKSITFRMAKMDRSMANQWQDDVWIDVANTICYGSVKRQDGCWAVNDLWCFLGCSWYSRAVMSRSAMTNQGLWRGFYFWAVNRTVLRVTHFKAFRCSWDMHKNPLSCFLVVQGYRVKIWERIMVLDPHTRTRVCLFQCKEINQYIGHTHTHKKKCITIFDS